MSGLFEKPWLDVEASPDLVEKVWNRFMKTQEIAEQVDFPKIYILDARFTPLHNDIITNYDEYHAKLFIYGLNKCLDELEYC